MPGVPSGVGEALGEEAPDAGGVGDEEHPIVEPGERAEEGGEDGVVYAGGLVADDEHLVGVLAARGGGVVGVPAPHENGARFGSSCPFDRLGGNVEPAADGALGDESAEVGREDGGGLLELGRSEHHFAEGAGGEKPEGQESGHEALAASHSGGLGVEAVVGHVLGDALLRVVELDAANLLGEEHWVVGIALGESRRGLRLVEEIESGDLLKHRRGSPLPALRLRPWAGGWEPAGPR